MKLNIAVLLDRSREKNAGGRPGYLYNLYMGAPTNGLMPDFLCPVQEIAHLDDVDYRVDEYSNSFYMFLRKNVRFRRLLYFFKQGLEIKNKLGNKVNDYDVIHVHISSNVIYLRWFCKYKGKIILTSHRPETLVEDGMSMLREGDLKYSWFEKFFHNHIEKLSYKYADAFIFPSENAMKIYEAFPGFKKYSKGKKTSYVITGAPKKIITIEKLEYKKTHCNNSGCFMIAYVGRHTQIKGYDRLKNYFLRNDDGSIEVVVAGNCQGSNVPDSKNWHELGYITDTQNLLNAADVIVIPNRNTFFDLIIVEALSYGKIVISSNTGGNIDIAKLTRGLVLFDNSDELDLDRKISSVMNMSSEQRKLLENDSERFYETYCCVDAFASNYIKALDEVVNRSGWNER